MLGDSLVKEPEGVRQRHLTDSAVAAVHELSIARRGPFSAAVERHYRGFVERRREGRARFVSEVMLDEVPAPMPIRLRGHEAFAQMVRRAVDQLALGIHGVREEQ